jgi:hypothetical protein
LTLKLKFSTDIITFLYVTSHKWEKICRHYFQSDVHINSFIRKTASAVDAGHYGTKVVAS